MFSLVKKNGGKIHIYFWSAQFRLCPQHISVRGLYLYFAILVYTTRSLPQCLYINFVVALSLMCLVLSVVYSRLWHGDILQIHNRNRIRCLSRQRNDINFVCLFDIFWRICSVSSLISLWFPRVKMSWSETSFDEFANDITSKVHRKKPYIQAYRKVTGRTKLATFSR